MVSYVEKILEQLKEQNPQFELNGSKNLWIVKPGGSSRGRGIAVKSDYGAILDYIKNTKGRHWVVQKYIENPLIIESRKFDIRQWVLIEKWNPLTVWIYDESYIRFALQDYDPNDHSKFAHLTNNALTKEFLKKENKQK